jgi:hypothetical protein
VTIPPAVVDIIALAAEQAYRRGFQQGVCCIRQYQKRYGIKDDALSALINTIEKDASDFRTSFRLIDHATSPGDPSWRETWRRKITSEHDGLGTIRHRQMMELPSMHLGQDGSVMILERWKYGPG